MSAANKLLATARGEIGYLEKATNAYLDDVTYNAGNKNYTKYARDLDALKTFYNTPKQGAAWCDVFTDWCFVKTFGADIAKKMLYQPDKSLGAGCRFSAQYYKDNGAWYTQPEAGDQIFFRDSNGTLVHTGLVERVSDKYVYTIEGNTTSNTGVVSNGGGVFSKWYLLTYDRIAGYGRPNWDAAETEQFIDIHSLAELITPEDAYKIIKKANEYALTIPLPGWAEAELGQAVDAEITDGTKPMIYIPRYQAAIMAERAYKNAVEDVMKMLEELP